MAITRRSSGRYLRDVQLRICLSVVWGVREFLALLDANMNLCRALKLSCTSETGPGVEERTVERQEIDEHFFPWSGAFWAAGRHLCEPLQPYDQLARMGHLENM